jgi:hypothetical protein
MAQDVSRLKGNDAPVEGINPKDPPPEITKGLVADPPWSAKLSVTTSPATGKAPAPDPDSP